MLKTPGYSKTNENIKAILNSDQALSDYITTLLSSRDRNIENIVKGTSITSYRRIHEILGAVLDRLIEETKKAKSISLIELNKCLILVNYQEARGQINRKLANILSNIVLEIINRAKDQEGSGKLRAVASRARTLIDALAVLVYKHGKK